MNRGTIVGERINRKAVWAGKRRLAGLVAVLALAASSQACGDVTRQGTGSSYLIVTSLLEDLVPMASSVPPSSRTRAPTMGRYSPIPARSP